MGLCSGGRGAVGGAAPGRRGSAPPGELLFARLGSRRGRRGDRLRLARTRIGTNARGHAFCFPPSAFRLLEPPAHQPVIPRRHFARRVLTAPPPPPPPPGRG